MSFYFTSVGRSVYVLLSLRPKRLHCFQKLLYPKIKLLNRAMYSKVSIFPFSPCPHSLRCRCYLTNTHRLQYALIIVPSEWGYQIMGHSSCFLQFKQYLTLELVWYRKQAGLCPILHFSAVGISFIVPWNYSQELPHSLENDLWFKSRRVFHLENGTGASFHNLWGDLPCTASAAIHWHWSWVWEPLWHRGSKCCLQQWELWGGEAAGTLVPWLEVFALVYQSNK